jgi:two-component system cell cycle sensor histidine kinase/response regulator CckA
VGGEERKGDNDALLELRERAQQQMAVGNKRNFEEMSTDDIAKVVFELEVHQIELEMQNEELRRAQLELVEMRDQYSELYDYAPIGYLTMERKGKMVQANLALVDMLEVTKTQLVSQLLSSFVAKDDQDVYFKHTMTVIQHPGQHSCELRLCKSSGDLLWVRLDSIAVERPGRPGEQCHEIRSVLSDISERKKAEAEHHRLQQQLYQARKMQSIGGLTAGIAHEFNNLLTPILGFSQVLLMNKSADDPEFDYLEQIQVTANRAAGLVKQLVAYTHNSASARKSVQLEECLDNAIKLVKKTISPTIVIKIDIEANLPPILGMPNELHQVILDLCVNADHAMRAGGELSISLHRVGYCEFTDACGQARNGHFLRLSMQDTGCGMEPDTMNRIFDPFFTTKDIGEGTGLGLSVVQGIIEKNKGYIDVDSSPGKGSTFHVYMPVAPAAAESAELSGESLVNWRPKQ